MNDDCRDAAAFVRSDLDALGDDPRSIAGLTSMARVLEAAATGAGEAKLRERIGEMATALLAMKRDDELLEQATREVHEAHKLSIEAAATGYLFVYVCACTARGQGETREADATVAHRRHVDEALTARLAELRGELAAAGAAA